MCLETTTLYDNCRAIRIHVEICATHIEHTRLQLDSAPCSNYRYHTANAGTTNRCRCKEVRMVCDRAISVGYGENGFTWSFDRNPGSPGERKRNDGRRERVKELKGEGEVDGHARKEKSKKDDIWGPSSSAGTGDLGRSASAGRAEDAIRYIKHHDRQPNKKSKHSRGGDEDEMESEPFYMAEVLESLSDVDMK